LAFDGSMSCRRDALEQIPSSCRRIWRLSAPAEPSPDRAQAAADSTHFRGVDVIEEARQ
jgi:hypothetical protein